MVHLTSTGSQQDISLAWTWHNEHGGPLLLKVTDTVICITAKLRTPKLIELIKTLIHADGSHKKKHLEAVTTAIMFKILTLLDLK